LFTLVGIVGWIAARRWSAQATLFHRFAEFDVVLRHAEGGSPVPEERQDAVDPRELSASFST